MRVDLRYVLPIVAFYLPGLMLLSGGWILGFNLAEMREHVAFIGGACGIAASVGAILTAPFEPIWLNLRKGENDD